MLHIAHTSHTAQAGFAGYPINVALPELLSKACEANMKIKVWNLPSSSVFGYNELTRKGSEDKRKDLTLSSEPELEEAKI